MAQQPAAGYQDVYKAIEHALMGIQVTPHAVLDALASFVVGITINPELAEFKLKEYFVASLNAQLERVLVDGYNINPTKNTIQ